MEIRCDEGKLFGEVSEHATGEFRAVCRSNFCKRNNDEVVLHIWNLATPASPIDTKRFKRPK